jgi:secreted PhoX family phosphatase
VRLVLSDLWAVSRGAAWALEDAPASFRPEPSPPIFTSRIEAEEEARRRAEAMGGTLTSRYEWVAVPLGQQIDWVLATHVGNALREADG